MYALFYLVSLAKYLRRRQTRMTESNSNSGKWFRDIAKTFISLRIFFRDWREINSRWVSFARFDSRSLLPATFVNYASDLRKPKKKKKKTQRSFIVAAPALFFSHELFFTTYSHKGIILSFVCTVIFYPPYISDNQFFSVIFIYLAHCV